MRKDLVACFGEPLIGFYESKDKKMEKYKTFYLTVGGDTSNVALQLSKFEIPVKFITRLGNDIFGNIILKTWDEWDIDISDVIIDYSHQTGIYFAIFEDPLKHKFVYKRKNSASYNYSIKDAEKVDLSNLKIFHLSGISQAISREALESSFILMERCKSNGIKISYDANYRKPLWSENYYRATALYTIRNFADILSINVDEASILFTKRLQPEEIVKELLNLGPEIVALKLGEKGGVIGSKDRILYGKSYPVEVADTVGAGDSFTASVLYGVLNEWDVPKIIDFANYCASFVCKHVGSTVGQPTLKEVKEFLRKSSK